MKKSGIFYLLLMIAFAACRDNINDVNVEEIPYDPPIVNPPRNFVPVTASLTGFVADKAGEPVTGASVTLDDMDDNTTDLTATTDEFGHFFFNDIGMNARGTLVRVEKTGFFKGSRRFFAVADETNRIKVELISKGIGEHINAVTGGTVEFSSNLRLDFGANAIKRADGSLYDGEVLVFGKWLDPSDATTLDQMPGNLQGVSTENEEVVLGTYGMAAVELTSPSGELLNIANGQTVALSMTVPSDLLASAPAEIPLWSYNEEFGIWVEESVATLNGDTYTGEVSHFSFWNCDYPYPLINFEAIFEDSNGNPLSNYRIAIALASFVGSGYTCPDGSISGAIPANQELELIVYDICHNEIYSQNIGPYADDVDLGTIVIDPSGLNATTFTGELVDCGGTSIQDGVVIIDLGNYKVYEYVSGAPFSVTFSTCSSTTDAEIIGVDFTDLVQSDPVSSPVNGTFDLGNIDVCGNQLENYIQITVDGVTAIYTPATAFADSTGVGGGMGTLFLYMDNVNPNGTFSIYMGINGTTAGNYDNDHFVQSIFDIDNNWSLGGSTANETFDTFVIDEYGDVGEAIKGTFSGTLTNYGVQPPVQVSVSGEFDIIL